jgi:hypothetical protein
MLLLVSTNRANLKGITRTIPAQSGARHHRAVLPFKSEKCVACRTSRWVRSSLISGALAALIIDRPMGLELAAFGVLHLPSLGNGASHAKAALGRSRGLNGAPGSDASGVAAFAPAPDDAPDAIGESFAPPRDMVETKMMAV